MTRIEIEAAQQAALRARVAEMRQPSMSDEQPDALWQQEQRTRDRSGNLIVSAFLLTVLEVVILGAVYVGCVRLAATALDAEAAIEAAHTAAVVQQMEGR